MRNYEIRKVIMKFTCLGGLNTAVITSRQLTEIMYEDCILARRGGVKPRLVFSSNGQGISLAASNNSFKEAMEAADLIHADGQSVVTASKLVGQYRLPERIATTDFFHNAATLAQCKGLTFFILGSTEDRNKRFVAKVRERYPKLKIVGRSHGYFDKFEEARLVEKINELKPDVVWVGLGKPKQEYWCVEMREKLNTGWLKTCGGLYSYMTGDVQRAPLWVQKIGFEWLFRAIQEPKRLGLRYLTTNPKALFALYSPMFRLKK